MDNNISYYWKMISNLQLELFVIAIFIYKGNLEQGTRTILMPVVSGVFVR